MSLTVLHSGIDNPMTTHRPGSREPWQLEAACAGTDPEQFFPEGKKVPPEVAQVCQACPVQRECRRAAESNNEEFGIWAGALVARSRPRKPDRPTPAPEFIVPEDERDQVVLRRYRSGVSTKEIAIQIQTSERTVHRIIARHRKPTAA